MYMQPSIFTRIINGEIPCHKVYEDDTVIAFLDIYPIRPGHILIVPKKQVDQFDDLDDETYKAVFNATRIIAKRVKEILGAKRACLRVEGFDVPHAHVHVIPCNVPEDFYNSTRMQIEPDHKILAELASKLRIDGDSNEQ
jgi:histidine triad (HIT) family protein